MTFRTKLSAGFGLAVALLLAVGVVSFRSVLSSKEHNRLVAHTYEVLKTLESVLLHITEAESARRGFQFTSEERYLEKYHSGLRALPQELHALQRRLADNPDQQRRLATLAPLIEQRLNLLTEAIALHRREPANNAVQLQFTARGKELMDQIRSATLEMEKEAEQLLAHRAEAAAASARQTEIIIVAGTSLALALALIAGLVLRREMAIRQCAEDRFRILGERFERFFTLSIDLFAIAGLDGYFKRLNPAWEKTLGFTNDELLARPYLEFVHPEDRERTLAEAEKLRSGSETPAFENRYLCKDGSYRWLLWSARLEPESQLIYASARDLTERRRAADDLAGLNRDLQHHAAELEASNKELETFTYSVSHDLRAPLRHIDGFSRILLEDYSASLDPEARSFLGRIRDSTQHMGRLVDDLLNLSSIGRQEVRPQITGLKTLVDEVLTGLRPELADRAIEWHIKDLPFVECDPGLLRQVFANLLSNAVKYSRPRDPAVISVSVVDSSDPPVLFVRDNGVGFSMKYADKLFGVFQRLHRQEDFEGTGVGLATVQRIIHKHGGRIWAEAELDRGATFYFTLGPARSQPTPEESIQRGAV